MNSEQLKNLQIQPEQKRRPRSVLWIIFLSVLAVVLVAIYFARPRPEDTRRVVNTGTVPATNATGSASAYAGTNDNVLLVVSGYIINRERIELSPRYLGVVEWIGVRKGDAVTNGQVVVRLDDAEYRARLQEAEGRLNRARAGLAKAELDFRRITQLTRADTESKQAEDNARLQLDAARADVEQLEGAHDLARTYLEWTVIRSPINGVVLERLVDPNELVVPQSFGGTRGPSTALLAIADPEDLQVEIDMNEADLSKVFLKQNCLVSPEAYPGKVYDGYVAEIAPEANRSKGTLQIKVQIVDPDAFLTPELSARVEFLRE